MRGLRLLFGIVLLACSNEQSTGSVHYAASEADWSCAGAELPRFDGEMLVFADSEQFALTYLCLSHPEDPTSNAVLAFEAALPDHHSLRRAIAEREAELVRLREL